MTDGTSSPPAPGGASEATAAAVATADSVAAVGGDDAGFGSFEDAAPALDPAPAPAPEPASEAASPPVSADNDRDHDEKVNGGTAVGTQQGDAPVVLATAAATVNSAPAMAAADGADDDPFAGLGPAPVSSSSDLAMAGPGDNADDPFAGLGPASSPDPATAAPPPPPPPGVVGDLLGGFDDGAPAADAAFPPSTEPPAPTDMPSGSANLLSGDAGSSDLLGAFPVQEEEAQQAEKQQHAEQPAVTPSFDHLESFVTAVGSAESTESAEQRGDALTDAAVADDEGKEAGRATDVAAAASDGGAPDGAGAVADAADPTDNDDGEDDDDDGFGDFGAAAAGSHEEQEEVIVASAAAQGINGEIKQQEGKEEGEDVQEEEEFGDFGDAAAAADGEGREEGGAGEGTGEDDGALEIPSQLPQLPSQPVVTSDEEEEEGAAAAVDSADVDTDAVVPSAQDFGDFGTAAAVNDDVAAAVDPSVAAAVLPGPAEEEAAAEEEANISPAEDGDEDGFSDFGDAIPPPPSSPTAAPSEPHPTSGELEDAPKVAEEPVDVGGFRGFGAFDGAAAPAEQLPSVPGNDGEEDKSAEAGTAGVVVDEEQGAPTPDDDSGFGAFAAFGDAEPPAVAELHSKEEVADGEEAAQADDVDDDDADGFGDFGSFEEAEAEAAAPMMVSSEAAPAEDNGPQQLDVDGSVGEKASGTPETAETGAEQEAKATPTEGTNKENSEEEEEEDDDDFGDFADFQDAAPADPADVVPEESAAGADGKAQAAAEFEAFGDGPTGVGANAEKAVDVDTANEANDEFRSFDDAAAAPSSGSPPVDPATSAPTSSAAAIEAQDENDDDDDDDDFGDFGDFSSFNEAAPSPSEHAPPPAVANDEATDEFAADFGQTTTEIKSPAADPVVEKASSVFKRIFGRYASKVEIEDAALSTVSVRSVLPPVGAGKSNKSLSFASDKRLKSLFSELEIANSPSSVIVNKDVPKPYAHYSVRTGGALQTDRGLTLEPTRKSDSSLIVPEVLSIDLPKETEVSPMMRGKRIVGKQVSDVVDFPLTSSHTSSADTSSRNGTAREPKEDDDGFADFESAPASGQVSEQENGDKTPDAVKQFLARVPDLSFMLKSELCLPKASLERQGSF